MKTVIEMAIEVGISDLTIGLYQQELERFAELVRADALAEEREACAKVAETYQDWDDTGMGVAAAIRQRSNT